MSTQVQVLISAGGLLCTILALMLNYFGIISKIKEAIVKVTTTVENVNLPKLVERLTALETLVVSHGDVTSRLMRLETRLDLLWSALDPVMKEFIHHPTAPRRDALIEKFPDLSVDELCELRGLVQEEKRELAQAKDAKAFVYALMVARIDEILYAKTGHCEERKT